MLKFGQSPLSSAILRILFWKDPLSSKLCRNKFCDLRQHGQRAEGDNLTRAEAEYVVRLL